MRGMLPVGWSGFSIFFGGLIASAWLTSACGADSTGSNYTSGGVDSGTTDGSGGGTGGSGGGTGGVGGTSGAGGAAGGAGQSGGASGQGEGGAGGAAGEDGGSAGSAGSGLNSTGCADGTREGFVDAAKHPSIAGCDGAWSVPGVFDMPAMCNRQAGNSGPNPDGMGCTVTDLCAPGWRVCFGRDDVLLRNPNGCEELMDGATGPLFFTTQMSSTGAFLCSTQASATNDLFGCGDLGCNFSSDTTVQQLCAPLSMTSHDLCKGLRNDLGCGDWCNHLGKYPQLSNAWDCGTDTEAEALNVVKTKSGQGGVLCCIDDS